MSLVLAILTAACSRSDPTGPDGSSAPAEAVALDLSPKEVEIAVGDAQKFSAIPRDSDGRVVSGYEIQWWSSNPEIAPIDDQGEVTALDDGTVTVKAVARSTTGSGPTLEESASVHSSGRLIVEIAGVDEELAVGDTVRLTAEVLDSDGEPVDRNVKWTSDDGAVATVDNSGLAEGVSAGETRIVGSAGPAADTVDFTVVVPGDSSGTVSDSTETGDEGTAEDSDSTATQSPTMPPTVNVDVEETRDDSAKVHAWWDAVESADSYRWEAGSNSGTWRKSGEGLASYETSFLAPVSESTDTSWFCVWAVNEAGESEQRCASYELPASSGSETQESVSSVDVTPESVEVEVSHTVQLDVVVHDADGSLLDRTPTWRTSNSSVATVDATGLVTGQSQGSAEISAEVDGFADTVVVDVLASSSDGGSGSDDGSGSGDGSDSGGDSTGESDPWLDLDFEEYGSTAELRESCEDFNDCIEDIGLTGPKGGVYLDESVGYGPGGLSKSMRYDWVNQGTSSVARGRAVDFPNTREAWFEIVVRFSADYITCNPDSEPCDHKNLVWHVQESGRWGWNMAGLGAPTSAWPDMGMKVGWCCSTVTSANYDPLPGATVGDLVDEEWHVLRFHIKHSTDQNTADGLMEFWLDGEYLGANHSAQPDASKLHWLALGRNKDKGRDSATESWWIGRVRIWQSDPGWNR